MSTDADKVHLDISLADFDTIVNDLRTRAEELQRVSNLPGVPQDAKVIIFNAGSIRNQIAQDLFTQLRRQRA